MTHVKNKKNILASFIYNVEVAPLGPFSLWHFPSSRPTPTPARKGSVGATAAPEAAASALAEGFKVGKRNL